MNNTTNTPHPEDTEKEKNNETTEESSDESLKELQRQATEKDHQINQQLESLWTHGTTQMLGDHAHEPKNFTPHPGNTTKAPIENVILNNNTQHAPENSIENHELPALSTNDELITINNKDSHEKK